MARKEYWAKQKQKQEPKTTIQPIQGENGNVGVKVILWNDLNLNDTLDEDEIITSQVVWQGQDGIDGKNN